MAATTITRTAQVLAAARANRTAATELEVERLLLALEWAELHPGDDVDETVPWAERDLEIAGAGAPTVAEFSIAEFALAVGLSTDQGIAYVGDAVELCHRLPRTWARVLAGEVVAWKARKVAQQTRTLPMDAASFVDRALASVLHRCSFAQIERTVDAARAEFDPAAAEERWIAAAEERHFDVHVRQVPSTGLVAVEGMLDLADAMSLHETITAKAATLDPELPLDVRRSMAAGMLGADSGVQREVVIYTHAHADTEMVEVENTRTTVTPEQVREWCQQAGTMVTVRPVLDLNDNLTTDSYTPTPRQQEQVTLTFPRCVFPGCCRPSRRSDKDHIVEWPTGATESRNLAPLCRFHHRLKTFTAWSYHRIGPSTFVWTSPHGQIHVVDTDRHIR
jgi:hypothetical protein